MAKLTLVILFLTQAAFGLEFVPLGQIRWPTKTKIGNTRLGGLSAIVIEGQKIYFVSDDRGTVNEPRFYEFDIKPDQKIWKLENGRAHFVEIKNKKEIVDMESMVPFGTDFFIGSEGDNNKKPRVMPKIFQVTKDGLWRADLLLPDKVLPEASGMQKKGVANNFAFEDMAISPDGETLWFTTERPLVQDVANNDNISRFRFFEMKKEKGTFKAGHEFYFEGLEPISGEGISLVSGWSDMLYRGEKTFWILERSLRLLPTRSLSYDCRLAEIDFSGASQVENENTLPQAKNLTPAKVKKTYSLDFKGQSLGNCEGIVIGPPSGEYKQTLWVVTDNNFSKDDTALYFFGVKE